MDEKHYSAATIAAQAGGYLHPGTGALVPGIEPAVTFARDDDYALKGPLYSRYGSPTVEEAEVVVGLLEGGARSLLFGSGLAAVAAALETVPAGGRVLMPRIMYFGAQAWAKRLDETGRLRLALYDQAQPGALDAAIAAERTDLVWIETPANPTWDVVDIAAAAEAAHRAGAMLVVDGTCAPPCTTRALALGADISFQSATKYLNGHSDVLAGVLSVRADDPRFDALKSIRTLSGAILSPFEAWLLIRGLRTLYLRFERASENALALARHLEGHARVARVLYPGLQSHPGHGIARRQMTGGFGGMLSILVNGSEEEARRVATRTRLFKPATSLGGVESLIEHRRTIEGEDSPTPGTLLRVSVGVESADDLIDDLEQALG